MGYYLTPYLQKVKKLRQPILLVDLFAGPGTFGDGSNGSPIILLEAAKRIAATGHSIRVLLIEKNPIWAEALKSRVASYGGLAEVHNSDSLAMVGDIARLARSNTTFLYVDPFSISRLHLGELAQIFATLQSGSSVELLFVFMAPFFMRWAASCLAAESMSAQVLYDKMVRGEDGRINEDMARALWDADSLQPALYAVKSAVELDAIAGGAYWREYMKSDSPGRQQAFVDRYCVELRRWFSVVCNAPVYADGVAKNPKYWMVFGTRYRPAIDLINRAIKQGRQIQAERNSEATLFAKCDLPPELPLSKCRQLLIETLHESQPLRWDALRWAVTEAHLGKFTDSEINGEIKASIRAGAITGADGSKTDESATLRLGVSALQE